MWFTGRERLTGRSPLDMMMRLIAWPLWLSGHRENRGEGGCPDVHGNVLRTAIVVAVLATLILAVGATAGGVDGLTIAVLAAVAVSVVAYFWSDRIVLSTMHARPVSEVEYPQLGRLVRELSSAARTPVPRVYV